MVVGRPAIGMRHGNHPGCWFSDSLVERGAVAGHLGCGSGVTGRVTVGGNPYRARERDKDG